MAKIAVEQRPASRLVARGEGWSVSEFVCTLGPRDQPFEERHAGPSIAVVLSGTFQYHSKSGRDLMTPGSLMLGSPGQCFECGHEHGAGDRCLAFAYTPEFFERLSTDAGAQPGFNAQRLPPLRALSPLIARASAALVSEAPWDELSLDMAAQAVQLDRGLSPADAGTAEAGAMARVTRVVRRIEDHPEEPHDIDALAREARLSPYHFLRTFQRLTGVTPHQYLLRLRLRRAAVRLSAGTAKILDIALDSGFGDISNFNRSFRAEFGESPRAYRNRLR